MIAKALPRIRRSRPVMRQRAEPRASESNEILENVLFRFKKVKERASDGRYCGERRGDGWRRSGRRRRPGRRRRCRRRKRRRRRLLSVGGVELGDLRRPAELLRNFSA